MNPGVRELSATAFQIGENAIASFLMESINLALKNSFVVHSRLPTTGSIL
jgi:hypothetical protein